MSCSAAANQSFESEGLAKPWNGLRAVDGRTTSPLSSKSRYNTPLLSMHVRRPIGKVRTIKGWLVSDESTIQSLFLARVIATYMYFSFGAVSLCHCAYKRVCHRPHVLGVRA